MTKMDENGLILNLTSENPSKPAKNSFPVSEEPKKNVLQSILPTSGKKFLKTKKKEALSDSPGKDAKDFPTKSKTQVPPVSLFTGSGMTMPLLVKKQKSVSEQLFSEKSFEDFNLHPHLVSCLISRLEVIKATKVQEETIPIILDGRDVLVKSCTGSGKTLAYAIPIVQKLQEIQPKIKRSDGIFALIIVPTRELALQCFEIFSLLSKAHTWIVPGYLTGGEKKKSEKARLRKGINILISTPGRLLDHLDTTVCLSLEKILFLVIDEADRLLEEGFEESVAKIVSKCNKNRQSALLSATLTKEVENFAGMSLFQPVYVGTLTTSKEYADESHEYAIPKNLKQFITVVPTKLRLVTLSGFIVDNCLKFGFKGLIFMTSQNCVDFHYSLFSGVLAPILLKKEHKCKFYRLHGNMKQEDRTEIFHALKSNKEGILLCTDVAARGLDLPSVDWIVQYSAPPSAEIYIHRVGRTARIGKKGNSLLFLLPSESKFSYLLSDHKINFEEIPFNQFLQALLLIFEDLSLKGRATMEECASALHRMYENEVYDENKLHESAKEAFSSYVKSYAAYPKNMRHILCYKALHLGHVAKSLCLREAPSQLNLPFQGHKFSLQRKKTVGPIKRKIQSVSEFDSGLPAINFERKHKKKRTH
ncbi:probable ATP-dependent RNA helicase DDX31 [Trichonephila clavata]|uniref:ATP-dependent RNA helicase n=1 Tax=Trichonephila clavata TaxID=2740835 RepID=A0A8X6F0N0_TRICU|nr:probable ATP-dependent RNA helicase DDX31 [Trichonephila clavata]